MNLVTHLPLVSAFGDPPNTLRAQLTAAAAADLPHGLSRSYRQERRAEFAVFAALGDVCATHRSTVPGRSTDWETLHRGPGWLALVACDDGSLQVTVQADAPEVADRALAALEAVTSPVEATGPVDEVTFEFCHAGSRGVRRTRRPVAAPSWEEVRGNYTEATRNLLEGLCAVQNPAVGRLVLMWGEPGTGKTTAVRALARSWASWCRTSYILDPEALFGSSEYFHEMALGGGAPFVDADDLDDLVSEPTHGPGHTAGGSAHPSARWRLLVVEDADELIAADAKQRTGQALSRLLNLTDGIVGQGTRTIVLITTNEPLSALHPALSRPGRCLARLEVSPLTLDEARAWLIRHDAAHLTARLTSPTVTLAELYEMLGAAGSLLSDPHVAPQAGYL